MLSTGLNLWQERSDITIKETEKINELIIIFEPCSIHTLSEKEL